MAKLQDTQRNLRAGTYASVVAVAAFLVTFATTYVFATKDEVSKLKTEQVKQTGRANRDVVAIQGDIKSMKVKVDIIYQEQQEIRRSVEKLHDVILQKLNR